MHYLPYCSLPRDLRFILGICSNLASCVMQIQTMFQLINYPGRSGTSFILKPGPIIPRLITGHAMLLSLSSIRMKIRRMVNVKILNIRQNVTKNWQNISCGNVSIRKPSTHFCVIDKSKYYNVLNSQFNLDKTGY